MAATNFVDYVKDISVAAGPEGRDHTHLHRDKTIGQGGT